MFSKKLHALVARIKIKSVNHSFSARIKIWANNQSVNEITIEWLCNQSMQSTNQSISLIQRCNLRPCWKHVHHKLNHINFNTQLLQCNPSLKTSITIKQKCLKRMDGLWSWVHFILYRKIKGMVAGERKKKKKRGGSQMRGNIPLFR